MTHVAWLFLASSLAALVAWLWLRREAGRTWWRRMEALADQRGWNIERGGDSPTGPRHLPIGADPYWTSDKAPRVVVRGPARSGSFALYVPVERSGSGCFMHMRVARTSNGVWLEPRRRPTRLTFPVDQGEVAVDHGAFHDRFAVYAAEPAEGQATFDWQTCALVLHPARPLRLAWEGQDVYIRFPDTPVGPEAMLRLTRFADALARHLVATPDQVRHRRAVAVPSASGAGVVAGT